MLAMEVLSLLGQPLSPQQEQLVALCLRALHQLSRPGAPAGDCPPHVLLALAACKLAQLVPQLGPAGPPAANAEAVGLLQLMAEYVKAAPGAGVAVAAMRHCSAVVQSLVGVLLAAGLDPAEWAAGPWRLLHRLAALLAAVAAKCHNARAGRALLRVLVADQQAAAMFSAAASLVLLYPEVVSAPSFAYRAGSATLQRELLQLLIELAARAGRQPAAVHAAAAGPGFEGEPRAVSRLSSISSVVWEEGEVASRPQPCPGADLLLGELALRTLLSNPSSCMHLCLPSPPCLGCPVCSACCVAEPHCADLCAHLTALLRRLRAAPGPKGGQRLTRSQAFQLLWPFISPQSGFARRILDHEPAARGKAAAPPTPHTPASGDSVRLRHDVLQLLRTAFSAPGNPFVLDKGTTGGWVGGRLAG